MAEAGSVADCVRSHIAWITLLATEAGGELGRQGTIDWAYVPGEQTVHLLFPERPATDDVAAIADRADALGATKTALWSDVDRSRRRLAPMGFERAWQPWWMSAEASEVPLPTTGRVALVTRAREHDGWGGPVVGRPDVLLAEATVEGRYAGRAWMHLDGDVAGLYYMNVWPNFQRRGLGSDLLGILTAEAARRGARVVTMNATPDGAELYRVCGFRMLGAGRTWWRHRR